MDDDIGCPGIYWSHALPIRPLPLHALSMRRAGATHAGSVPHYLPTSCGWRYPSVFGRVQYWVSWRWDLGPATKSQCHAKPGEARSLKGRVVQPRGNLSTPYPIVAPRVSFAAMHPDAYLVGVPAAADREEPPWCAHSAACCLPIWCPSFPKMTTTSPSSNNAGM